MKPPPHSAVPAAERVGEHEGRPLWLAALRDLGDRPAWPEGAGGFRAVFVFEQKALRDMKAFRELACGALDAGARAIVCAGGGAAAMQELIDEELVGALDDEDGAEAPIATAGCAPGEPLEETLWLAFHLEASGVDRESVPIVVAMLESDPRRRELAAALARMPKNVASGRGPGE